MSVRNRLYSALVKDLLGPEKGSYEKLRGVDDPRTKYITGILEPKDYDRSTKNSGLEDYTKSDITAYEPEEEHEEDRTEPSDDYEVNLLTPLDPRAFPKSMGISFVIRSSDRPLIHFCALWARYVKQEDAWKRFPDRFIVKKCDVSADRKWPEAAPGIRIVLLSRKLADDRWHVSIYLVNETKLGEKERFLQTHHLVFQPEIRVKIVNGTLESIDDRKVEGPEEKRLELLYREFPSLARGHLVGAVWKDIDPARPVDGQKERTSEMLSEDVKLLGDEDRELFDLPDIRTEYLPAYQVSQSTVGSEEIGLDKTDLRADSLADMWKPDELSPLEKLAKSYRTWVNAQKDRIKELPANHRGTAAENISGCEEAAGRIEEGIRILKTDEDARLAFCFMNQVMDTQAFWARKTHLEWRPFQMAFILQCIRGISDEKHVDRTICDLLWFPTGGGKTEAYLGLMVFTLALRRRKNRKRGLDGIGGAGTAVISRYTLRLLTIQQFRRALSAITACDLWRVRDWRPKGYNSAEKNIWGTSRFSIGLWVGGDVTPNITVDHVGFDKVRKMNTRFVGAVGILNHTHEDKEPGWKVDHQGEPAQVIKCPRCSSLLAIPAAGYSADEYDIHWTFCAEKKPSLRPSDLDCDAYRVSDAKITPLPNPGFYILSVKFTTTSADIKDESIAQWWRQKVSGIVGTKKTACAYPSRPGYFIRRANNTSGNPCDFEIRCPNPECELARTEWYEEVPSAAGKKDFLDVIEPFRIPSKPGISYGMPIPAYTVDAQVYARCPSVIIATADKFARLPFEPHSASIFGNVNRFDKDWGYYRDQILPDTGNKDIKIGKPANIEPFQPPELIIQDELHLIEGPLGSLAGLYECAVDALASRFLSGKPIGAKYIASTATIRQAASQVISLYSRKIRQFPQSGISVNDNFFSRVTDDHPLLSQKPGRLYVGVCAPGKGPQTPTVRIWSRLLQEAEEIRRASGGQVQGELDYYWTLVGYFNAIRELASAASLYRQAIPEWIKVISSPGTSRKLGITTYLELSSNVDSMKLPAILEQLEKPGDNIDAVLATSMFGTGVDINRLSLMVVHGQPKTTASYIQATGRVGRQLGALVVTFLRSTRPRDLAHYEFFTGYHRSLQRYVEPITVAPFSPRACDRALGPVAVAILRNGISIRNVPIDPEWALEDYARQKNARSGSRKMGTSKNAKELQAIAEFLDARGAGQPSGRNRPAGWVNKTLKAGFDVWENTVRREHSPLFYYEQTYSYDPEHPVVLGDAAHERHNKAQVYPDVPQSLREIEQTTRFGDSMSGQSIRPTQFVLTYGVGSIVETTGGPRVILDFEKWDRVFGAGKKPSVDKFEIHELSASQLLNKGRMFKVPTNLELEVQENHAAFNTGAFPRWALCERHDMLFEMEKYDITRCPGCLSERKRESARRQAIRFVRACTAGHLDDIDWHGIVHYNRAITCNSKVFRWQSHGSSLRTVRIRCPDCEQEASLQDVYSRTITCTGRFQEKPHMQSVDCKRKPQVTLRGSTSLRVPEIISTIAIPRRSSKLHRIFERNQIRSIILSEPDWTQAQLVKRLDYLSQQDPSLIDPANIDDIEQAGEKDLLRVIDDVRRYSKKQGVTLEEVKLEEFRELQNAATSGYPPDPTDRNPAFQVNKNDVNESVKWHSHTFRVTPIENLRVVLVQKGYRRLGTDPDENRLVETFYDDGSSKWYPAVEQFGEGVFIDAVSPLKIKDSDWTAVMQSREDRRCHPLFVWWHTFSHRLISALSVDSGYSTASIRERVYLDIDEKTDEARGGVLLYATQPGGDGSMGGLIALVLEFARVLESAERNLDACSNDPLCQEAKISAGKHNGAACYACLLLSETSCDHRNMYLDRNLLRRNR